MNRLEDVMEKNMKIGAFEAKKQLSQYLDQVRQGKEFVITKRGKPIARLVQYREPPNRPAEAIIHDFKRVRARVASSVNIREYMRRGRER